jgi:hypothetical protein
VPVTSKSGFWCRSVSICCAALPVVQEAASLECVCALAALLPCFDLELSLVAHMVSVGCATRSVAYAALHVGPCSVAGLSFLLTQTGRKLCMLSLVHGNLTDATKYQAASSPISLDLLPTS